MVDKYPEMIYVYNLETNIDTHFNKKVMTICHRTYPWNMGFS